MSYFDRCIIVYESMMLTVKLQSALQANAPALHRVGLFSYKCDIKKVVNSCYISTSPYSAKDKDRNTISHDSDNDTKDETQLQDNVSSTPEKKDFFMRRMTAGRRHVSPAARLQAILPQEFTNNVPTGTTSNGEHITSDQSCDNVKHEQEDKIISDNKDLGERQARVAESIDENRYKKRSSVLPSRRLSSLIPQEYWDTMKDSEMQELVEDLGENPAQKQSFSDDTKKKKK